jgi:hypothetical protein
MRYMLFTFATKKEMCLMWYNEHIKKTGQFPLKETVKMQHIRNEGGPSHAI